jgi:hypothetical protein
MRIAYSTMLFARSITDGRSMMCSVLTLSIGINQRMVASALHVHQADLVFAARAFLARCAKPY